MTQRVRFTILTMFSEKELFSVRETTDGSICVLLPNGTGTFAGEDLTSKDSHITAHPYREHHRAFGYRIKSSLLSVAGDYFDSHIIITDLLKNGIVWPMANALNGLASARPFKRRSSDVIVPLIGYPGFHESLCYTVFVFSKHIAAPKIQGFSQYRHEFSKFSLVIYTTFYHQTNESVQIIGGTMSPNTRKNKVPIAMKMSDWSEIISKSFDVAHIERYLQGAARDLATQFTSRHPLDADDANIFPRSGEFDRWPSVTDDFHEEFGLMSRRKNEVYINPFYMDGTVKSSAALQHRSEFGRIPITKEYVASIPESIKVTMTPEARALLEGLLNKEKTK